MNDYSQNQYLLHQKATPFSSKRQSCAQQDTNTTTARAVSVSSSSSSTSGVLPTSYTTLTPPSAPDTRVLILGLLAVVMVTSFENVLSALNKCSRKQDYLSRYCFSGPELQRTESNVDDVKLVEVTEICDCSECETSSSSSSSSSSK